jgi:hypothetical protein
MARENKPGSPKRAGKSGGPVAKPKASTSYSPAPMSAAAKAKAAAAGKATAAKTKNPQGLKQMNFDKKAKPKSTAAKAAGVVGKVAGKAAGIAKSKVKADIKAAKTVAGFAAKAYQFPGEMVFNARKAIAKTPTQKLYSNKNMKKK